MRIMWTIIAVIMIIVGLMISGLLGAKLGGGEAAFAFGLGHTFGLPVLILIIVSFFEKFRNIKSLSKAFAISTIVSVAVAISTLGM